jgi:two-component system OmpR family response regulator
VRILLAEPDLRVATVVLRGLEAAGHDVAVAVDGESALATAGEAECDVAILDAGLPVLDGFEVCRRLRAGGRWFPVLLLTGPDERLDRSHALEVGADECLGRPFSFAQLAARVRALASKATGAPEAVYELGGLRLEPATRSASRGGERIHLSRTECAVLEALMQHPGEVLTRARLLEHAWPVGFDGRSNVVDVYVRYLREKVDRPFGSRSIETVHGAGYRFRAT